MAGSGPQGRVTLADIERAAQGEEATAQGGEGTAQGGERTAQGAVAQTAPADTVVFPMGS